MTSQFVFDLFKIEDLKDLPNEVMNIIMGDIEYRNEIYCALLAANNYDMSYDWFQNLYELELAERGQKKQDFTPNSLSVLTALITQKAIGSIYEPTAGNGSMIIAAWWERCKNLAPWEFYPSQHMVTCWELSARAIPILLLNLSIRGMMGYVYHGDVLERTIKTKYVLLNRNDDAMGFSEIILDVNKNQTIYEVQRDNTGVAGV